MLRLKSLISHGINFLYPPTCHSCDAKTTSALLCDSCSQLLEPFFKENCCKMCLSERECFCFLLKPKNCDADAAYLSQGPILDLDTDLLAKPLANLAYLQFLQKHLPKPSSILTTHSKKFGKEFAKKLGVPFNPKNPEAPLLVETDFDALHLFSQAKKHPNSSIFTLLSPKLID